MRLLAGLLAMSFSAASVHSGERASLKVDLRDAAEKTVASAEFVETLNGELFVFLTARALPPGKHAFGVHEGSSCEPPEFRNVGAFLKTSNALGQPSYGVVNVKNDGTGSGQLTSQHLSLSDKTRTVMGHTIVIDVGEHADPDGSSGEKLACGIIPNLRR
jgi:superoxide dismutase, Cu-Zn family